MVIAALSGREETADNQKLDRGCDPSFVWCVLTAAYGWPAHADLGITGTRLMNLCSLAFPRFSSDSASRFHNPRREREDSIDVKHEGWDRRESESSDLVIQGWSRESSLPNQSERRNWGIFAKHRTPNAKTWYCSQIARPHWCRDNFMSWRQATVIPAGDEFELTS